MLVREEERSWELHVIVIDFVGTRPIPSTEAVCLESHLIFESRLGTFTSGLLGRVANAEDIGSKEYWAGGQRQSRSACSLGALETGEVCNIQMYSGLTEINFIGVGGRLCAVSHSILWFPAILEQV